MHRPRNAFAEKMPFGHTIFTFVFVADGFESCDERQLRRIFRRADHDVENRLCHYSADRRAADMLDRERMVADRVQDVVASVSKKLMPFFTVRQERDGSAF